MKRVWPLRGLIEGFYGPPWSWEARREILRWCRERGMTDYVYAPKNDPQQRTRWREPYSASTLHELGRLVHDSGVRIGVSISPGLSMDYGAPADRAALRAKLEPLVERGIGVVMLAFDDIPPDPYLGRAHVEVTNWLYDQIAGRAQLVLVPTVYTGTAGSPYLHALAEGLPADVLVGWTGPTVVNDRIGADDARARATAVGGRPPLLMDNYPVNDLIMADRLFLGPLRGRDPALAEVCAGYLANPTVQPRASKPALASIAAYLRGDDPVEGWDRAVDGLGWRPVAEACDGNVPNRLVDDVVTRAGTPQWWAPLAELVAWLRRAETATAPGLDEDARPWLLQTHQEAAAGLLAASVVQATHPLVTVDQRGRVRAVPVDNEAAVEGGVLLAAAWAAVRHGTPAVLGPRAAVRFVADQWPDGQWRLHAGALQWDGNALDHLVRHAFDRLAGIDRSPDLVVTVDNRQVHHDELTHLTVPPGQQVHLRAGGEESAVTAPAEPPLPDPRLDRVR